MGHARVISRADDGLSLARLMVGACPRAVLPMGAAMAAAAAAPTIPAPSQPPATGPPVRVAYWPLPMGCLLGGGPVVWGRWRELAPIASHPMTSQLTCPAMARRLQAWADGTAKAQNLARPTLDSVQRAADLLGLQARISHASGGWTVWSDGYPYHQQNLASVARFLLTLLPAEAPAPAAPARSLAPYAADLGRALGLGRAPRPWGAVVADAACEALTELSEAQEDLALALAQEDLPPEDLQAAQEDLALAMAWEAEPAPAFGPDDVARLGFATLNPETEGLSDDQPPAPGPLLPGEAPRPAPAPMAGPAPFLPPFLTYSQQQQQPQQAPAAPAAPLVQPGPLARRTAPAHLPADVAALLQRFGLTLEGLLTVGASNAKLAKGAALAWPVILHHLPARSLAAAIAGPEAGPTAPRSRLPGLAELAKAQNVYSLALAHNGCPWASAGCAAGCLAWAGHGGLSVTVASARARRTLALLADGPTYARAILWAIARAYRQAQAKGLPLAVRLRGTDDQPWHLARLTVSPAEAQALARRYGLPVAPGQGQTLPEALSLAPAGSIRLYEYSKAPASGPLGLQAQASAGFDVTASLAADRPDGLSHGLQAIAAGFRLAVPAGFAKGQALPPVLLLRRGPEAPAWRLLCIDGDITDHRWADPAGPQPGGFDGVAVILRTKRSRGRGPAADAFSLAPIVGAWQPLAGGGQAAFSTTQWEA